MGHRERKKQHTRQQLTEAAFELFARDGYDATTVEMIAERAMVSSRTFFRYFETKHAVLAEPVSQMLEWVIEHLAAAGIRGLRAPELIRLLATWVADGVAEGRLDLPVRATRVRPDLAHLGASWRQRWANELAAGLARLNDRAEPTFEERVVAHASVSLIGCAIDEWVAGGEQVDLEQLTERAITTMWAPVDAETG